MGSASNSIMDRRPLRAHTAGKLPGRAGSCADLSVTGMLRGQVPCGDSSG